MGIKSVRTLLPKDFKSYIHANLTKRFMHDIRHGPLSIPASIRDTMESKNEMYTEIYSDISCNFRSKSEDRMRGIS
jgi:hypothetical protein